MNVVMTDGSTSVRSEVKKVMTKFQQMYPNRACFIHQLDKAGILYRHTWSFFFNNCGIGIFLGNSGKGTLHKIFRGKLSYT